MTVPSKMRLCGLGLPISLSLFVDNPFPDERAAHLRLLQQIWVVAIQCDVLRRDNIDNEGLQGRKPEFFTLSVNCARTWESIPTI